MHRLLAFLFCSTLFFTANAAQESALAQIQNVGNIDSLKGDVGVKREKNTNTIKAAKGISLQKGDEVTTAANASAYIKLINGSTIILDASTDIIFMSDTNITQKTGKAFYKVNREDAELTLNVKTPSSQVGIKGTAYVDLFVPEKVQEKPQAKVQENNETTAAQPQSSSASVKMIANSLAVYQKRLKAEINNYGDEQQKQYENYFKTMQNQKEDMLNALENEKGDENASMMEQAAPVIVEMKNKAIDMAKDKATQAVKEQTQKIVGDKAEDISFEHFDKLLSGMK